MEKRAQDMATNEMQKKGVMCGVCVFAYLVAKLNRTSSIETIISIEIAKSDKSRKCMFETFN